MGDRGNIAIKQDYSQDRIYLYTHWGGYRIASALQDALSREERWTDTSYLTRIIFESLVLSSDRGSETGYGISVSPPDNEHLILDVDTATQTVSLRRQNWCSDDLNTEKAVFQWTFREFCELEDPNQTFANLENDDYLARAADPKVN